jgi:hypothetical protein
MLTFRGILSFLPARPLDLVISGQDSCTILALRTSGVAPVSRLGLSLTFRTWSSL